MNNKDKLQKRSGREELEYRHNLVADMIAKGVDLKDIKVQLSDTLSITKRQVSNYIDKVFTEQEEREYRLRDSRRGQMRYKLNRLYLRCLEEGKLNVALNVLEKLCKLDALDIVSVEYLEVNHTTSQVLEMTPIQKIERIRELYIKQNKGNFNPPSAKEQLRLEAKAEEGNK